MSAMCVLTPVIVEMSWPVLSGLATAALTSAGYKLVGEDEALAAQGEHRVELAVKQNCEFADSVGEGEEAVFRKGKVTLFFSKGADGKLNVRAAAEGMKEEELKQEGLRAVNAFLRAYVREKVSAALKKRGFKLEEQHLPDGTIRLKAKRWS